MDATAARDGRGSFALRMLAVLALAALLFCARLSERALWSEEVRWAQIPREMQATGDYLWPTINGRTYYDKPLGSYWLVLLASFITGGVDETSARIPSALSGIAAVAFAMLIARRLYDDAAALWSGVILATSFSFVFFARTASTDVETIAGVLAALWIFLRHENDPPGWWTILLWFVMAITSLTKGLLGLVLPIAIIGIYSTIAANATRPLTGLGSPIYALVERNRWILNRWSLAAIPLGGLVYLGPFLLSIATGGGTDGLEMVYRENVRRFFDPVNHRGPIYLYTWVIFMLLAPWSLLLPAALLHAHTSDDRQCRGRAFALAYFWGTFVFFTLSSSRRSYYLLPILPAAAFLIARMLTAQAAMGRATTAFLYAGFFLMGAIVVGSLAALIPAAWFLHEPWSNLPPLPCPTAFVGMWLASVIAIGYSVKQLGPRRIALACGVIAVSSMSYLYLFALPAMEIYRTQVPFAEAVKETVGTATDQVALYRTREIVFYLGAPKPLAEYHTPEELREAKTSRWIILRRRDWDTLNMNGNVVIEETTHPWENAAEKLLLIELDPTISR